MQTMSTPSDSSDLPDPVAMSYEEIVIERINNLAAKEDLRRSLQKEKKLSLSAELKITQELLAISERNEALAQQQIAELLAERHTMVMPQFLPHTDFNPELEMDLDNLPPEPKTKRKLSVSKAQIRKVLEMSLEDIQAELKIHRARMVELEAQLTSSDFDTRFNAQMEIRSLTPRLKKLNAQEIALLKHEIACMKQNFF